MRKETDRTNLISVLKDIKEDQSISSEALSAIQHIIVALCNLEEGVVDPIFNPTEKKANRPKKPSIEGHYQAMTSATLELLMKAGKDKDTAAKMIAKKLTEYGFKKQGRADNQFITAATVKMWRNEIILNCTSKNQSRVHPLYKEYRSILDKLEHWFSVKCIAPIGSEDYELLAYALMEELDKLI